MSKKRVGIITILLIALVVLAGFFWYSESGSSKEVPKRARLVSNYTIKGDDYR